MGGDKREQPRIFRPSAPIGPLSQLRGSLLAVYRRGRWQPLALPSLGLPKRRASPSTANKINGLSPSHLIFYFSRDSIFMLARLCTPLPQ